MGLHSQKPPPTAWAMA